MLHKGMRLSEPRADVPAPAKPSNARSWVFIASRVNALDAAQSVVNQAIDFLVEKYQMPEEQAYILCSVALDLKISQWVNQPMVTITGHLSQGLFEPEK